MAQELNIGLNVNRGDNRKGARDERARLAAKILCSAGYAFYYALRQEQSSTEETLVVQCCASVPDPHVYAIALLLDQDCIAVLDTDTGEGKLIGPRADAWGEFNPEFFIRF